MCNYNLIRDYATEMQTHMIEWSTWVDDLQSVNRMLCKWQAGASKGGSGAGDKVAHKFIDALHNGTNGTKYHVIN